MAPFSLSPGFWGQSRAPSFLDVGQCSAGSGVLWVPVGLGCQGPRPLAVVGQTDTQGSFVLSQRHCGQYSGFLMLRSDTS